jgi:hypothetical protein
MFISVEKNRVSDFRKWSSAHETNSNDNHDPDRDIPGVMTDPTCGVAAAPPKRRIGGGSCRV